MYAAHKLCLFLFQIICTAVRYIYTLLTTVLCTIILEYVSAKFLIRYIITEYLKKANRTHGTCISVNLTYTRFKLLLRSIHNCNFRTQFFNRMVTC